MNKKIIITIPVLAGLGFLTYYIYKKFIAETAKEPETAKDPETKPLFNFLKPAAKKTVKPKFKNVLDEIQYELSQKFAADKIKLYKDRVTLNVKDKNFPEQGNYNAMFYINNRYSVGTPNSKIISKGTWSNAGQKIVLDSGRILQGSISNNIYNSIIGTTTQNKTPNKTSYTPYLNYKL